MMIEMQGIRKVYSTGRVEVEALKSIDLGSTATSSWRSWAPPAPASRRS